MENSPEEQLHLINSESNELQKCRNMLFLLQFIMTTPAIISIINTELEPATLLSLSIASTFVLLYYWTIKYRYVKYKFITNDTRRSNIFTLGFPEDLPSKSDPTNLIKSKDSGKLVDTHCYVQTKENCIYFLGTLLKITVLSNEIYKKSKLFYIVMLMIYFMTNIILLVIVLNFFGGDLRITASRIILFAVNIVFLSDILNMIISHFIVSNRLSKIEERLLILDGLSKIKIEVLRTNLIDESGFFTDTMSNAYEIPPFLNKFYKKDLENRWEEIRKNRAKLRS